MTSQLEGMKQSIKYLSIYMEKQGNMETKLQELNINYDKLASGLEMHYNIIMGFARGSQLAICFPHVFSCFGEREF